MARDDVPLRRSDAARTSSQAIAALAYAEMLETGFTRVGEFHYLHHDLDGAPFADAARMSQAIVAAADETGIRPHPSAGFYAHGGFGGQAPGHGQRRFLHDLDGFARLMEGARAAAAQLPDAVVGIAPHSLRAVTADELRLLEELAPDGPIHIHIAEQVKEVEDCLAWCGARPVEWLLANTTVDARWCLVHATHMTAEETAALATSGAVAGLCPITEANLGDGVFPAAAFLAAGGRFGVGSDSNVLIDLAEELRLLEYGQRLTGRSRNVLAGGAGRSTGEALFTAAVAGGAQALGVESGIAIGRSADLISLDGDQPGLVGRTGGPILDSWLFAAGRGAVDGVWRRGRKRVERGRHVDGDAIRGALSPRAGAAAGMSLPLHERIRSEIEAEILSGTLQPEQRLPVEHELMRHYGCSRMTVSKALSALAAAGLVDRRKRAGSSWRARASIRWCSTSPTWKRRSSGAASAIAMSCSAATCGRRSRQPAGDDIGGAGPAARGSRACIMPTIGRLRWRSDWSAWPLFRRRRTLISGSASPGAWLLRHVPWTEAETRIAAVAADRAAAARLDVAVGSPCLLIERRTWRGDEGITLVRQLFVGAAYDLIARFGPTRS